MIQPLGDVCEMVVQPNKHLKGMKECIKKYENRELNENMPKAPRMDAESRIRSEGVPKVPRIDPKSSKKKSTPLGMLQRLFN